MIRQRWCLAIHPQIDYNLVSTSLRVRMLQVDVDHLSMQGSSIERRGLQLYSKYQLISLCIIQKICTDGILVNIGSMLDNRAHFRHSCDGDNTFDGEVSLIVGR